MITPEELIREQHFDPFCSQMRSRLNGGELLPFAANDNGYFVRKVESTAQIVVPRSLRARVLHLSHQAEMAGHPGGRKLYYSLWRDFYWPAMAVDCYATVRECVTCAGNRIKLCKNRKTMTLFPEVSPLECVSIDILGELIRTMRKNRYLLFITDRFFKLVRTVPMKKISSTEVAKEIVHHWVFVYGPAIYLLSDIGSQFTSRLFQDVHNNRYRELIHHNLPSAVQWTG